MAFFKQIYVVANGLSGFATSNPVGGCKEDWLSKMDGKIYTIVLVILQYVLPLTLIAIAYVWIAVDLWKPRNLNSAWTATDRKGREKRRKENVQIVKTLATIVVLFAICMLPGHIAWLLGDFYDEGKNKVVAAVILRFFDILVYVHSCLNPIVYGTLTKYFRREYSRYISYVFCCRKQLHSNNSRPSHNPTHENILPRTLSL
ncbi:Neuropeptide FF receptor 2 [Exaiptasia diaphana]|nr:Neuropeptide FF receptor 2 [Exaiptasia diaphana]